MDEFEKIRAFSEELGKKTEEAVAAEAADGELSVVSENVPEEGTSGETTGDADFLENWNTSTSAVSQTRRVSKTFWFVLAGVTLLLVCLISVIYLLLKGPIENEEIVTIAPTQKPVKIRPENPGGMVIPDQDKVIYSRLTQDTIPAKVEKLFPEEEKPVMPVVTEEKDIPVFVETQAEEVKIIDGGVLSAEKVSESEKKIEKTIVQDKQSEKPTPEIKVPEIKPEVKKGEWKVQLFSSTDKKKVEKQWQIISKKHRGLVSDMPMQIVPAKIAGKGTFYRLQLGAFETRQMASNLCVKLKKQKQDCIPAK